MVRQFVLLQSWWLARGRAALVSFENSDDRRKFAPLTHSVVIGGWGIEIEPRRSIKRADHGIIRIAFLGGMLKSKGLETMVEAIWRARAREPRIEVKLREIADPGNPTNYTEAELILLSKIDGVTWMGKGPGHRDRVGACRHCDPSIRE
ncbi:hypothetical protein [Bradyrhizobium sacchari]|nr:hypothetical protein [Bradyrhizobium sacchari]